MDKTVAIKVDHLTKVYKLYDRNKDRLKESLHIGRKSIVSHEHYALNDVNLEVHTGETVGIIGTNALKKKNNLILFSLAG